MRIETMTFGLMWWPRLNKLHWRDQPSLLSSIFDCIITLPVELSQRPLAKVFSKVSSSCTCCQELTYLSTSGSEHIDRIIAISSCSRSSLDSAGYGQNCVIFPHFDSPGYHTFVIETRKTLTPHIDTMAARSLHSIFSKQSHHLHR